MFSLRVSGKLFLLGVLSAVGIIFVTYVANTALSQVTDTAANLTEQRLDPLLRLNRIARLYSQDVVDLAHKSRAQMMLWSESKQQLAAAISEINQQWDAYRAQSLSPVELAILDNNQQAIAKADQTMKKLSDYVAAQSSYGMGNFVDLELYPGIDPVLTVIDELADAQRSLAAQAGKDAAAIGRQGGVVLLSAAAITLLITAAIGFWLNRSIRRPLQQLLAVITELERSKNLALRVQLPGGDEFGDIGRRFDRMMDAFSAVIIDAQATADQLGATAADLVTVSDQALSRVAEQKIEITQVVRGIEQVNGSAETVMENADTAGQVTADAQAMAAVSNNTVQATVAAIELVADTVQRTVTGMSALKESSVKVERVLDVINSIAEQTNLLSLNAAIEAARAGDHGRGFAVVANEVRELAMRTADSTREIHTIIASIRNATDDTAQMMSAGESAARKAVDQAQESGQSLATIIDSVSALFERAQDIRSACETQLSVANEVGHSSERLGELAVESAALSSKAMAATEQVATVVETLTKKLQAFSA